LGEGFTDVPYLTLETGKPIIKAVGGRRELPAFNPERR
jgi:hypothetical protein